MTQRHLIELLMEHAPEKGEPYLRLLVKEALDEFCEETLVKTTSSVVATDGTATRFALPADCIRARRVYGSDNQRLVHSSPNHFALVPLGTKVWWIEHGELVLVKTAAARGAGATTEALPADSYTLHYAAYATEPTSANLDEEIDLPRQLQMALEARVMERLARPEERSYWYAKWRDFLRRGRRWANENRTGAPMQVIIHEI